MRYIFEGLLVLHLVAWAIVLGGWMLNLRSAQPVRGTFHGALTALVTGLLMAGMIGLNLVDDNVDWRKLVAKFVIALVVTALAWEATETRNVRAGSAPPRSAPSPCSTFSSPSSGTDVDRSDVAQTRRAGVPHRSTAWRG